ncbi:MAG TPA: T9SS type A sorting domain-containing protein [Prolixibacteraceae bacterium]|nr:T9SS type A sorting domain-containing protein [Prolixibacteraceae bacterium]
MKNNYYATLLFVLALLSMVTVVNGQPLAFPGAEGHGAYTSGGRGGVVHEVTNLNDSGAGSLRSAIEASGTRTVVFRVSGIIELESGLTIRNDNITIAGQTAPGDGVCLKNHPLTIKADNVIIRYLRSRLGDEKGVAEDAMWGREHKNIIIDHCSMSWSVDEAASFYDNENFTLQWCIISESLYNSVHPKGKHGYGGIWGGMKASFHHNLIAHHTSRNPRFNGSRYHKQPDKEIVDFRNNVIYNWGKNSIYGGEKGNHNMVNNYFKSGPATHSKHNRIVEQYDEGNWYITGNYIDGYPEITADNWAGGVQPKSSLSLSELRVDEPFSTGDIVTQTAEDAFASVLEDAGCNVPVRDEIDKRIVNETLTGTATYGSSYGSGEGIIDAPGDVGGWVDLASGEAPEDTDQDGMPDYWEDEVGVDKNDPEDRNMEMSDGTTVLELYLNSLVDSDIGSRVKEIQVVDDLNVFPNPVANIANIQFSLRMSNHVNIAVFDISGREVKKSGFNAVSGFNSKKIDVSMLNNGIYFLKMESGASSIISKIIVRQ